MRGLSACRNDNENLKMKATLVEVLSADPDIMAAYLFGSHARGAQSLLSDVDVAVLLQEQSDQDNFHKRLTLLGELMGELRFDRVDLIILNESPPALTYRIIKEGILLFERPDAGRERIRFEKDSFMAYFDLQKLHEAVAGEMRKRIKEGRFGG